MGLESTNGKTVLNTKEIMLMVKNKEMASFITLLVKNMSVPGQMENNKVKEKLLPKMVKSKKKGFGKMALLIKKFKNKK